MSDVPSIYIGGGVADQHLLLSRANRHGLIATVHERSHHSDLVAAFHERAHRRYADGLELAIARFSISAAERKLVVSALITAVEGLLMHDASKRDARRMISFLVERLIPAHSPPDQHPD